MDGLTLLGVEKAVLKEKAPYIGGALGALVGVLAMAFTGKHGRSRWTGKAMLPSLGVLTDNFRHVSSMTKNAVGMVAGAAVGGGIGYAIKKRG